MAFTFSVFRSIKAKLLVAFLVVGVVSVLVASWQTYSSAQQAMENASFERLTAVRETKRRQVETYFRQIRNQVLTLSEGQTLVSAMREFRGACRAVETESVALMSDHSEQIRRHYEEEFIPRLGENVRYAPDVEEYLPSSLMAEVLQYHYIVDNPYKTGTKDNLVRSEFDIEYARVHAKYHPILRSFLKKFGYYDIFLVDATSGDIVYSVFKEVDFGMNLFEGPYRDTNLARAVREANAADEQDFSRLVDYELYEPSYGAPASFIASPIFDGSEKIGILVFQMPIDRVNQVMTGHYQWRREGLGNTGETYIVGPDYTMRNDSRFLIEDREHYLKTLQDLGADPKTISHIDTLSTSILHQRVDTFAARQALSGNSGTEVIEDYRGVPVLSSYTPLDIEGVQWAMLSEIDRTEAFEIIDELRSRVIAVTLAIAVLVSLFAGVISYTISKPISLLMDGIEALRNRDSLRGQDSRHGPQTMQLVEVRSKDEIGVLASSFNEMARELQQTTVSKRYVDNIIVSMNDSLIVARKEARPDSVRSVFSIERVNPFSYELLGYTEEEMQGRDLSTMIAVAGDDVIDTLVKGDGVKGMETAYRTKDGRNIPVLLSGAVLRDSTGDCTHVVCVAHDITAQKRAEDALKQANRMKDQFLANTSHELRTPLNGIIGIAESLIDGVTGGLREKTKANLSIIAHSGRRLSRLVDDILDSARLRRGQLHLQRKPVDLCVAAETVISLSRALVGTKPLMLVNRVDADTPLLDADQNRLHQILHNLIGNAIKFSPSGTIAVSTTTRDRGGQTLRDMLGVVVSDEGIGIDEENIERIFEEFEQADGSIVREYGGTGLGLSLTRQLVELHGGCLWVESEAGRGARFTFTLPRSDEVRAHDAEAHSIVRLHETSHPEDDRVLFLEPSPRAGGFSILVVDDEQANRQVLGNYLSLNQYSVSQASSGAEALEFLRVGKTFDLVVLDVMMPKMSGYEVCARIRERYLPNQLPVIMLTAKNQVADLVEGFSAGANDYLPKPFSRDELLSRVKTQLHLSKINESYERFVPHEFLRTLGRESIIDVALGDQIQGNSTVLFSDIRDYTSLSEIMTPKDNFDFLNGFLSRIGPVIRQHNGFVNQIQGDGIMALYLRRPEDAVRGAIALQLKVAEYNAFRSRKGRVPIQVGCGLHNGSLILGIIGDRERLSTNVVSDTVNVAARVEGLTKYFGASILITEPTLALMNNPDQFTVRFLGKVQAKGKREAISVYEVYDGDPEHLIEVKLQTKETFERGLGHYFAREFAEATVCFKNVLKHNSEDRTARLYIERAAEYIISGVPDQWQGVEKVSIK